MKINEVEKTIDKLLKQYDKATKEDDIFNKIRLTVEIENTLNSLNADEIKLTTEQVLPC